MNLTSETTVDAPETSPSPRQLPPPLEPASATPILAIVAGVSMSVLGALVLFAASRFLYIYILYNALLGTAIGYAVSLGPQRSRYANVPVLFILTFGCSFLAYVSFNVVLFVYLASKVNLFAEGASFLDFATAFAAVCGGPQKLDSSLRYRFFWVCSG